MKSKKNPVDISHLTDEQKDEILSESMRGIPIALTNISNEAKDALIQKLLGDAIAKHEDGYGSEDDVINSMKKNLSFPVPQNSYTITYSEFIRNTIINIANWHVAIGAPAVIYMSFGTGFSVLSHNDIDAEYLHAMYRDTDIDALIYTDGHRVTILKDDMNFFKFH